MMGKTINIRNIIIVAVIAIALLSAYSVAKVTVGTTSPTDAWQTTATNISFKLSFTTVINGSDASFTTGNFSSANCTLFETWTNQSIFTKNITTGYIANGTISNQNISSKTYTLQDTDSAGYRWYWNCSNATVSESVVSPIKILKVDATVPTIRTEFPTAAISFTYRTSNLLVVNFTASDKNLKSCDLMIDGVVNKTNYSPNNGTVDYFGVAHLEDGTHTIATRCQDIAGNQAGNATNVTLYFDTTAPSVAEESLNLTNASWRTGTINMTFIVTDLFPSNCSLFVDNGNSSKTFVINETSFLTTGNRTNFSLVSLTPNSIATASRYYVSCKDKTGRSTNTTIKTVYVDNTNLPSSDMTLPTNGTTNPSRRPLLQWTASGDPNFLNYKLQVFNRSGTLLATTNITANYTTNYSLNLGSIATSDQWYLWNVTVYDQAGNRNTSVNASYSLKVDGSRECYYLTAGWNYCGLMNNRNVSASTLATEIGSAVTQIAYYNASKALVTHVVGTSTNNFDMSNGTGILIYATADVEWNSYNNAIRSDVELFAVNLTNATIGGTFWNYYPMQNRLGMTFAEIEIGFNTLSYNYTKNEGVVAIAKVNDTGIYSYILGTGKPWNLTFNDYGEGTYYMMGEKNVSLMWNFTT